MFKKCVVRVTVLAAVAATSMGLGAGTAHADLITGKLQFDGAPPTAAVIFVRDPAAAIAELTIDQKNRQFNQFMNAGSTGAVITFHNSDTARHNLYANSYSTGTRFDVGLIPPGKSVMLKVSWPEDSIVRVGCAIHSQMETYVANIRSAHFQLLPFKQWQPKHSGALDDYDANAAASTEFEQTTSKEIDIKLRSVPTTLTSLTLLAPYFPALNFELAPGETKTLDVIRDGAKRGTLTIKRS